jgi:hypothetical protein
MYKLLSISNINSGKKKIQVDLYNTKTNKIKTIKVGSAGMGDYTIFNKEQGEKIADEHKERYINRHQKREDWTKTGITSNGFWAKHLLWNKRTMQESIKDVIKKYNL